MRRTVWPVAGLIVGAVAGGAWGWFGAGGYEANDSAIGTAFLCGLAGLLLGAVACRVAEWRDRSGRPRSPRG
ncbi:hypothetical protein ACFQS1_24645 [Paractinoplanes rhizophilus]|jgi:hypothetical protein|uniref:Uncharacterized protein n=1 Tax=Paractinoplanes rhizophilus TaxID=1416877 RepID=A0ABW2HVF6_9ACTN|nr:hypothetical protein [Actinoplanes sp.]